MRSWSAASSAKTAVPWALGNALTAAGNAAEAVRVLRAALGPGLDRVLPVDRPAAAADLVEAQLAAGDVADTVAVAERARGPHAALAGAALLLAQGDGDDPLTAREREIAALIAAGRTNREVAEQLVLSTRTIEAHLRSIYAKLGVRSRVELARDLAAADR